MVLAGLYLHRLCHLGGDLVIAYLLHLRQQRESNTLVLSIRIWFFRVDRHSHFHRVSYYVDTFNLVPVSPDRKVLPGPVATRGKCSLSSRMA